MRQPIGYSLNGVSIYHEDAYGNAAEWIPGVDLGDGTNKTVYYIEGNVSDAAGVERVRRDMRPCSPPTSQKIYTGKPC